MHGCRAAEALTNGHSSPRLPEAFHTQMVAMYSSAPKGASARPFACKHINIMDPLAASNNLGRSVSKASFLRLRKALKRGALTLGQAIAQVCFCTKQADHRCSDQAARLEGLAFWQPHGSVLVQGPQAGGSDYGASYRPGEPQCSRAACWRSAQAACHEHLARQEAVRVWQA